MKLKEIFQRSDGEKVGLVTNNSDYFLFYREPPEKTVGELKFALEKVSDLTKCGTQGAVYHFKEIEEADEWLKTNYEEYEEY